MQYFPKKTKANYTSAYLANCRQKLNIRPRKCLRFASLASAFFSELNMLHFKLESAPIDSVTAYKGNFHCLTIKNYKGLKYDWDFWYDRDAFRPQWGILFNGKNTPSTNLFIDKMRKRFGNSLNCTPAFGDRDTLYISLLEIPKQTKGIVTISFLNFGREMVPNLTLVLE